MKRLLLPFPMVCPLTCGGSGGGPGSPTAPSAGTFTVGGTVSGLSAGRSLVLHLNGASNLTVSANGGFTFGSAMSTGSGYAVTVQTQPVGQTCSVTNQSGAVGSAHITNVGVACGTAIADSWTGSASSISSAISATALVTWRIRTIQEQLGHPLR